MKNFLSVLVLVLLFLNNVKAENTSLKVQLQWFDQSQFAGFYVAQSRKYFDKEGLNVELIPRSSDKDPISILQSGEVDIAVSNLNNALIGIESNEDIINVAQIFNKSGLEVICRISQEIIRPSDIAGKTIGYWGIGDDNLVKGMLHKLGITIDEVKFVRQKPDGKDLIDGNIQCATSMSYNESISILNPEQFNLAIIEDGIYVKTERLKDEEFKKDLVKFIRALRNGWEDARLAPNLAVEAVLRNDPSLNYRFQQQMLEEVLKLIPSKHEEFGVLDLQQLDRQTD